MPDDALPGVAGLADPAATTETPPPQVPAVVAVQPVECGLTVGGLDERGNTVKYIYSCDHDYVVYYSRLEHRSAEQAPVPAGGRRYFVWIRRLFPRRSALDLPYESEGVQAQLSGDPATRKALRKQLLPLGTDRAKLQALLNGWPRRQSYDTSIATALQLALIGENSPEANKNALQTLTDAKTSILAERESAGRAQYVKLMLICGLAGLLLLVTAQHNLFRNSGLFWLGTQAGLIGAIMSIALSLRGRMVAPDIGFAANLSDSALRLIIGAISGGTLVLLFSCGLIPPLHTLGGDLDAKNTIFALLLGIIAGFVEKLVPSLLDDQAQKIGGTGEAKPPPAQPQLQAQTDGGKTA